MKGEATLQSYKADTPRGRHEYDQGHARTHLHRRCSTPLWALQKCLRRHAACTAQKCTVGGNALQCAAKLLTGTHTVSLWQRTVTLIDKKLMKRAGQPHPRNRRALVSQNSSLSRLRQRQKGETCLSMSLDKSMRDRKCSEYSSVCSSCKMHRALRCQATPTCSAAAWTSCCCECGVEPVPSDPASLLLWKTCSAESAFSVLHHASLTVLTL